MTTVPIFNAYSGELYNLLEDELNNILEGEIPLNRQPNRNCKHCYGRANLGYDSIKRIYHVCPKCVYKNIHPSYTNTINFNYINISNLNK
jgi:hypothetical protein